MDRCASLLIRKAAGRTNGRSADGERHPIQQAEAAPEEIFLRPDEEPRGSTRIVKELLRMSRGSMEMFQSTQKQLVERLLSEPALEQRVERLMSIRAVGPITALTWALEIADPHRFASIANAVSYCGLTAAFRSSAGKQQRGPISKQRNAWLQPVLIEAAKLAPRWNPQLAALHARALQRGHPNRATLQVARKLVAYLLAVDKSGQPFQVHTPPPPASAKARKKTARESRRAVPHVAGRYSGPRFRRSNDRPRPHHKFRDPIRPR
jgi:hypothetical protein